MSAQTAHHNQPTLFFIQQRLLRIEGDDAATSVNAAFWRLPIASDSLASVTCQGIARRFDDAFALMRELHRVLRPGGTLIFEDRLMPDDERAAYYVNSFYRLADPTHRRALAAYGWEGLLLDGGFRSVQSEPFSEPIALSAWAHHRPQAIIERLQIMLAQAPQAVRQHLEPEFAGTEQARFRSHRLRIVGQK